MADKRIILITGANSGVGYAAAKIIALSSPHYHILVASRTPSKGEAAVSSLKSIPNIKGTFSFLPLDVTSAQSISTAVSTVTNDYGRLDALINNAGITSDLPSLRDQLEATLATNVIGAASVYDAFKPLLLKSKNGYLIHVSSGLGSMAMASDHNSPHAQGVWKTYRMSKAALNMMAVQDYREAMREGWGLKVFALCPGLVESNLRGTDEKQRSAGGRAISADTSGETILSVLEGKRDADVGKFVHKGGVYEW